MKKLNIFCIGKMLQKHVKNQKFVTLYVESITLRFHEIDAASFPSSF